MTIEALLKRLETIPATSAINRARRQQIMREINRLAGAA